jgi:hypothetical protein
MQQTRTILPSHGTGSLNREEVHRVLAQVGAVQRRQGLRARVRRAMGSLRLRRWRFAPLRYRA